MLRHLFPFTVSQLSNLDLTLALVVSLLVTTAQANTSLGSDAPAPETESQPSNTAASTSGSGGLSRTAKIVIGVVVGMVGISAISGAVFFFFRKKKKQNKKTKRHETISTYHDAKRAGHRQHQMPFRRQWQPDPEQGMIEIAKIERDSRTVRDSVLPKYDPSSFHRDHYSIDSSRGAMSLDIPREPLLSYHHQHNRNSLSFSKVMAPIPLPPPPPPPLPSMPSAAEWNRRSATEANNSIRPKASTNKDSSAPAVPVSTSSQERPKGPKKPKPTLARLITNL